MFESYHPTAGGLGLFRIFTALFFLFFLMPVASYYSELSQFPADFYNPPPGPMMLLNGFPPAWFFFTVHVLLVGSWIGVLVGYKTRVMSLAASGFMLILLGFIYSIGKVNHQMLLVLLPGFMAFSGWGRAYSFDSMKHPSKQNANGWPLVLLALFIGFMFFTAGFPKFLGGWLNGDTLATKGHLLNQYFVRGRTEMLSGFMVQFESPFFWGALDWATVLFEAGFLIAVLRAGWTRLFVGIAVLFHFSTMLTLNIGFLVNFPAYAAFLPWDKIELALKKRFISDDEPPGETIALKFGLAVFLVFLLIKIFDATELFMTAAEPSFNEVVIIGSAVLIALYLGLRKGIKRFSNPA
jgi:hypothetical protein